jgi:hypothetical protein
MDAMVLSGGGVKGAYQAGAIEAVLESPVEGRGTPASRFDAGLYKVAYL